MWDEPGDGPLLLQVNYDLSAMMGATANPSGDPARPLPAALNGLVPAGVPYVGAAWGNALTSLTPLVGVLKLELTSKAVKRTVYCDLRPGTFQLPRADTVVAGVSLRRVFAGGAASGWLQGTLSRGHYARAQELRFSDLAQLGPSDLPLDITRRFVAPHGARRVWPVAVQTSASVSGTQLPGWVVRGGTVAANVGVQASAPFLTQWTDVLGVPAVYGRFSSQALAGQSFIAGMSWQVDT